MGSVTFDAPFRVRKAARCRQHVTVASVQVGNPPEADVWSIGHRDQLVVVEAVTDRRLGELPGAEIISPSWKFQGVGTMSFKVSTDDESLLGTLATQAAGMGYLLVAGTLRLIGVEVEWWRDGELRWKGVPVSAEVDDGILTVDCFDLGWYLTRRFMGDAERNDLLNGAGSMDQYGLPGWAKTGTCQRNTTTKVRGVGAAQLDGSSVMTYGFRHPAHRNPGPITVMATAMVRVQEASSVDEVLMTLQVTDPTTGEVQYPDDEANRALVREDSVLGGWQRITCWALIPPGRSEWGVTIKLYNSTSIRYFDDVRVLKDDHTGFEPPGKDLAWHGKALIDHANAVTRGKADTGIRAVRPKAFTGTVETMGVRHLEHTQILDIINTYGDREDGWEWWIHPWTREFCIAPRRGVDHTNLILSNGSVGSISWNHDESDRGSAVVVIGEGSGPDRPEGGYRNGTRTAGLILDYLERPPNGTELAALDPMAKAIWDRVSLPQVTLGRVEVPAEMWPDVSPGDRFPVQMSSGVLRTEAELRVSEVIHDLERDVLVLV